MTAAIAPYGDAAMEYLRTRLGGPLPLPSRAKWPPPTGWTGWAAPYPTGPDVAEWAQARPNANIGLRLADGLLGLDVDAYGGKDGHRTLTRLEQLHGPLPSTVRSTSRGDGVSGIRLYRVPTGLAWLGVVTAKQADGTETKGIETVHHGHRYAVCWPSAHADTGSTYRWLDQHGKDLGRLPTVDDLPDLPESWVRALSRGTADEASQRADLNDRETGKWLEQLDDGAACDHVRLIRRQVADAIAGDSRHDSVRDEILRLLRAGEQGHPGARTGLDLARTAFVSTVTSDRSRTVEQAAGEWDRMLSGGVRIIAGSPSAAAGAGCSCPEPWDGEVDVTTGEIAVNEEPWPEPEPLTTNPASIDVSALPAVVRDIVMATAESVQTPIEVPLTFALGALSAATRGCWDVQVKAGWNAGPTSLYAVTLADSGERKSNGSRPLVAALDARERDLVRRVNAENRSRKSRQEGAEAQRKQAQKDGDEDGVEKFAAIAHENRRRPVPALVLSDTTTEALGVHMEEQGGATALFNTEATAFATVAGHYSDRGGNVGLLNHAYDGERFADRRIKRAGVTIPRPFLAWAAAVQTQVLTGYANGTTEGSGFLSRFLLLLPTSMVGLRRIRTEPIPAPVQAAWDQAVGALHERAWAHYAAMSDNPEDYGEPLTITLSSEAADALLDYNQQLEDAKRVDHSLRELGSWIEKHPARLARIAALFALLDNPYATVVEKRHLDAAMSLAEPLVEHAKATMRILRNVGDNGPVRRLIEALRGLGLPTVSTRDVHRRVMNQGWVRGAEDVREQLRLLEDLGYVRPAPATRSKHGRPTETWRVHPSLLAPSASSASPSAGSVTSVTDVNGNRGGSEDPLSSTKSEPIPEPPSDKSDSSQEPAARTQQCGWCGQPTDLCNCIGGAA